MIGDHNHVRDCQIKRLAYLHDFLKFGAAFAISQQGTIPITVGTRHERCDRRLQVHDRSPVFQRFPVGYRQHRAASRRDDDIIALRQLVENDGFTSAKSLFALDFKD